MTPLLLSQAQSPLDWSALCAQWPALRDLDSCPQDKTHHAEGNVGTHTRMVLQALRALPEWQTLPEYDQTLLFWAAVGHDIGKPKTTATLNGRLTSPGHSALGAKMLRDFLISQEAPTQWREEACHLVAAHQLPFWLLERDNPHHLAIKTSLRVRPYLLCLHAKADALGRVCADQQKMLDCVEIARMFFEEQKCLQTAFSFSSPSSKIAFFQDEGARIPYDAHDHQGPTAYIMAGLPGSGKDTWLTKTHPQLPVISLDTIRRTLNIAPNKPQGKVAQAALEQARTFLRSKTSFAWNATNITRTMRQRILGLCHDYNAKTHLVYIEPKLTTLLNQNKNRHHQVPQRAMTGLLQKLDPPTLDEAHFVSYIK